MSDSNKPKRLAKTNTAPAAASIQADPHLYIMPYTPKSIVVMGETLNHSNALASLGGKYMDLHIGSGWLFAKIREESVQNYINTGEVVPYVYSDADRAKFDNTKKTTAHDNTVMSGIDEQQLRKIFCEFREAFEPTEDYEGKAIIDVIYQLEEKHFPARGKIIKAASKKTSAESTDSGRGGGQEEYIAPPTKRLARKNVMNAGKNAAPTTKRLLRKVPAKPLPTVDSDSDAEMESDSDVLDD